MYRFDHDSHHLTVFEDSLMGFRYNAGGDTSGSLPLSASLIHENVWRGADLKCPSMYISGSVTCLKQEAE